MKKLKQVMNKLTFLFALTVLLMLFLPVRAAEAASTDVVNIPDAALKADLNEKLGVDDPEADITQGQLAGITGISVGFDSEVSDLTGLEYCTNLEWLRIYSENDALDLSVLANFPKLFSLSVNDGGLKDVSQIEVCTKLTQLDLEITNLPKVPNVPTLTELTIDASGEMTKTDLSAIKNMSNLTKLSLAWVGSDDYSWLSKLTKLQELSLRGSDITVIPDMSAMKGLLELDLAYCYSLTDISELADMKSVTLLDLNHCEGLKDISAIAGMTNLKELELERALIFDEEEYNTGNANAIAALEKLEFLGLAYVEIGDAYNYMFLTLNNLKTLIIGFTDITDLSFLQVHTDNLDTLVIRGLNIDNGDTAILAQMKNLRILGMGQTYITDFSFLSQLPYLTAGSIRWTEWWSPNFRTTTSSSCAVDVMDTETTVTIKNDIVDINGNNVAPIESDKWTYNAADNTITIVVDTTKTSSAVTVKYEFDMTSQKGSILDTAHRKTVRMYQKKSVKVLTQPEDKTILVGTDTSMSVTAEGEGTLSYQWYKDGVALTGETGSTITFTDALVSQSGSYTVKVTDSYNNWSVTSVAAVLTVQPLPITITTQPTGFSVIEGKSGSLSVTATGTAPLTYQWYKDGVAVSGATGSTLTFSNIQVSQAGSYYVIIKDQYQQTKTSNAVDVKVSYPELKLSGSVSSAEIVSGNKLTITAKATGGSGSYTYSYLIYNKKTKAWARLTAEFVESNTYVWTAGAAGERAIYVEVKDSNGTLVRSNAMAVKVIPQPLKITATSSAESVILGDKVTIKATATGGSGSYTYSYLVLNKQTGQWARLTSFKEDSTFTWKAGSLGDRAFYVEVKDSQGTVIRSSAIPVKVTPQPLEIVAQSSAESVMTGNKITISATATGGVKDYTYSFLILNKKTGEWARLTSFKENSTFTWKAGSLGDRAFYVEVKDSTGAVTRSKAVTVEVIPQPLTITAESSAESVKMGNKVTISATATGGTGGYTYSVLVYNVKTREWARLTNFKESNTFTWTAGSAGDRRFYVEVKDSAGTVTRSSAVTVKVK